MGPHLTPHTPHSDQISSPVQPQVSHGKDSDVSFHTAAYSQCSNTETAQAGASEEDPQTRNPWAFYTLTVSQKSPLPPESLAPALLLSVSIHLTGSWPLSPLLSRCVSQCPFTWLVLPTSTPSVIPKVGSSWPPFSGSYPELCISICISVCSL